MINFESKPRYGVYDLKKLMELLRGPGGCPWDAEQTHKSIRRNMLEEAFEAAEAIDDEDMDHLLEELGDVLIQVIFHANISEKAGSFDFDDIADATCRKLIRRHPHVFGDLHADNGSESVAFWEDAKREEKRQASVTETMRSVTRTLPALWRAEKIQKKAAKAGFDWPEYHGALTALRAELYELEDAIVSGGDIHGELGDLLFSAVNVARFFDIDPEEALGAAGDKFISRFAVVESGASEQGLRLEDMSLDEMEALYQQAKLKE